jgi:SCAMP family.
MTPQPQRRPVTQSQLDWKSFASANGISSGERRNSTKRLNTSDSMEKTTGHPVSPWFIPLASFFTAHRVPLIVLVFPLIFHSITEEIPEASQPLITRLYQLWLVLVATLILNMVACIFILLAGSNDGGRDLGASIG